MSIFIRGEGIRPVWWHDLVRTLRLLYRHVRYGLMGRRRAAAIERDLTTLYRVVNGMLASSGARWWLCYGTLLGWHRHQSLIPGDNDIDFGCPAEDAALVWAARSRLPRGFTMHDTSRRHPGPKFYVRYRGWEADIYFYQTEGDVMRCVLTPSWPGEVAPFPASWVHPLEETSFLGETAYVPRDTVAWLVHTYGYIGAYGVRDRATGYWRGPS